MKNFFKLLHLIVVLGPKKVLEIIDYSQYDSLTGLCTREVLIEEMEKEIDRAERIKEMKKKTEESRTNAVFSFCFIDLNDFGEINKREGHQAGDWALKEFSNLMKKELRKTDLIARWGGDEFVILFPETKEEGVYFFLERICAQTEKLYIPISFCFGISEYVEGDNSKTIIERADNKMLKCKREKNRT